jgi:signal transduction histidine kinase/ActR/RegA family two-component response regulator
VTTESRRERRASRLGLRLIAGTLLLLSVVYLISSLLTLQSDRRVLQGQLDLRGRSLASVAAGNCIEALLVTPEETGPDYPLLDTFVQTLVDDNSDVTFARVVRSDGQLVTEAYGGGGPGPSAADAYQAYVAEVLAPGNRVLLGRIVLGISTASSRELIASRQQVLAIQAAISFAALAALLGFMIRRLVAVPVSDLDRQATALGQGDLETPISLPSDDELGHLARTLDEMRRNLKGSYDEVRETNAELRRVNAIKDQTLEQLERALLRAKEASKVKGEFMATMSHEIRTPMNGVIGMTALLLDTELDSQQREFADTIRHSAEALLLIVNDVLDFSKIEAHKLKLECVEIAVAGLVDDVLDLFRAQAAEKGILIERRFVEELPTLLQADPGRLRQILLNLVGNAVKFTDHGGVVVTVSHASRANERIWVRFEVADTGLGVPAAARATLFQPFTQADSSTTRTHGGTGLGLAISKQLVELMGGVIGFESSEGKGSTFWFEVPLREPTPSQTAKSAPALPRDGQSLLPPLASLRVLLVEDNAINRKIASSMLSKRGHSVSIAANGLDALEKLAGGHWDVVLMDCFMPVMDGFEATRLIRRNEAETRQHIPIIAMTANAMEGDRERCLAAGMDEYLTKPVRAERLCELVERMAVREVADAGAA